MLILPTYKSTASLVNFLVAEIPPAAKEVLCHHTTLPIVKMAFSTNHQMLRNSHPRYAGPYLRNLASEKQVDTHTISHEILQAITVESLPPRVYVLWLRACPDETAITLGLRQTESVVVRSAAIVAFRRWFHSRRYEEIWSAMGGSEGIAALLAIFSVNHVKMFCKQVAKCSTSLTCREGRQELTTELCQLLTSRFLTGSADDTRNPDRRPLLEVYATSVYGCTPAFQDSWIRDESLPELDHNKIFETNTPWFQQKCLRKAAAGDDDVWTYYALITSVPAKASQEDSTVFESTAFAAKFIEALIKHDVRFTKTKRKVETVMEIVFQQTARRKTSTSFTRIIAGLMSQYAVQTSGPRRHLKESQDEPMIDANSQSPKRSDATLDFSYSKQLHDMARMWVRDPDTLEPLLSSLLRPSGNMDIFAVIDVLKVVKPHSRYRLLKWLLISKYEIDIENDDQLFSIKSTISLTLFRILPTAVARDLFQRFVSMGHPGIPRPGPDTPNTELDLLTVSLHDEDTLRQREAAEKISFYRRKAETSRNAWERLGQVKNSVIMAVASRSLDLLSETLIWARRFIRDPVVTEFYWTIGPGPSTILRRDDTIELLSGIPHYPNKDTSLDLLATELRKGNDIALLLLETATMAQREPSFYVNHWTQVEHIFADIVQCRIKRADRLQRLLGLSDEQLFTVVWESILEALLKAEKLGLDERNQALQFNDIGGPLAVWGVDITAQDPSPATLRFINELAIRRDALWRDHRPRVHASVTTLQAPWPQGLPVQALLPINIQGEVPAGALPYLKQRAHNVIFVPREYAQRNIPEDDETRAAIGCFVEDYTEALKIHISWCGEEEKQRYTEAAWAHATTSLSEDRLSPVESRSYWGHVFSEAGAPRSVFESIEFPQRPTPKLPENTNQEQPEEWNPDLWSPVTIPERELHPTCLDCMTYPVYGKQLSSEFSVPKPVVDSISVPQFWDLSRFGSLISPDVEEALIAAVLLVIDSRSDSKSRILSTVFPEEGQEVRFPSLFLDSDFLERQQSSVDGIPRRLLVNTPPALLEQLVSSLMAQLCVQTDPSPALIKRAFTMLKQLAWSDKPQLAIKHIVRSIIDLPDQSSWHRVMLHPGVLKRLTADESKALVSELGNAISENGKQRMKLQEMAQQAVTQGSSNEPQQTAKSTRSRFVKVTTVKMLAQLMGDGEYVDEMFSVRVLAQLFDETSHIDIRAAAVDSLTSILSWTKDANVEEAGIKFLETSVVRLAAELSERSPMTEQRWQECEENCELPDDDSEVPIRACLIRYLNSKRQDHSKTRELVNRLYLPFVHKSSENKSRWIRLFLRANNVPDLIPRLPQMFGSCGLLLELLKSYPAHMPAHLFQHLHELILFLMDLPKAFQNFRARLQIANPPPAGRNTWINDTSAPLVFNSCVEPCKEESFAKAEDALSNDLIMSTQVQALAREMMEKVLAAYDEKSAYWSSFVGVYNPPLRQRTEVRRNWQQYCRPIVEYTIERIDSMRTPEWQRDPHRRPRRLPDTFPLRLWLLTYPSMPWEGDLHRDDPPRAFVNELLDLLNELADSRRPYHSRFEQVVSAAKQCYEQEWAYLAWQMGKLDEEQLQRELTTEELLRVELADTLLQRARGPVKANVLLGLRAMLRQWRECLDEDVRDRGIVTTSTLVQRAKSSFKDVLPFRDEDME